MLKNWLTPNWEPGLILPKIPINHFHEKNIKALFIDVDKTIIPGRKLFIDNSVKEWMMHAKPHFKLHLVSNNPSKDRINSVANQLGISYTYAARKPSKSAIQKHLSKINYHPNQVAIIGDRLLTDVLVGNRLGMYTVLIRPIGEEGLPSNRNYIQKLEKFFVWIIRSK